MRRGMVFLLVALLLLSGCTAQKAPSSAKQDGKLTVSTDWSKLEERSKPLPPIGSRWYAEYTGQLISRDDYGSLIPYAGLRLLDNWPAITGCLYGLMTTNGVVVTDAVYGNVTRPTYHVGAKPVSHPLLALHMRTPPDEAYIYGRDSWAIAARDGSWCTDFSYRGFSAGKNGLLLFEDDRITHMSPTGQIINVWTMADIGLSQEEINSIYVRLEWRGDNFGEWFGDYFCIGYTDDACEAVTLLHLPTGQKETIDSTALWEALTQASDANQPAMEDLAANSLPGNYSDIYYLWDSFSDNDLPAIIFAKQYSKDGGKHLFFLYDGTPLTEISTDPRLWFDSVRLVGGLIEVLGRNTASYYDIQTMECVFRTHLGYYAD